MKVTKRTISEQVIRLKTMMITCLIYLLSGNLNAQFREIAWGTEVFKPASASSFKVIGNWDEGIMMQSRTGDRLFSPGKTFIQRLDNMTMLPQFNRQVQLETSKGDKTLEYQVLERVGNKPVLFASYFNKNRDRIELFGRSYNLEGEPDGKEKKIAEFNASRKSQLEGLNFVHSADSTRMLAFFSERWDKYEREKIQFILFDSDLQTSLNRSIEFPYTGSKFSIHNAAIDHQGRIYLLVRVEAERKGNWKKTEPVYTYSLVTFNSDTGLVEDYEIQLADRKIVDIQFIPEKNGIISCAGFYAGLDAPQAEGVFLLKIDRNKSAITEKILSPFESSFTSRFNNGRKSRLNASLPDFKLDHFIQFGDSGYVLVAEQFMIDEICFQDFRTGMITCNYIYHYNNIVVIKLNLEGNVVWTADIPKFQETSNDGGKFSSYTFAASPRNISFIFNDHPSNTQIDDERKIAVMNNIQRAVPVVVSMNERGNYSRMAMGSEKRNKFFMVPAYGCQISQASVIVFAVSSNKYKTGIVRLGQELIED
jgi:hypothetical protein